MAAKEKKETAKKENVEITEKEAEEIAMKSGEGVEKNAKAIKFQEFLVDNNINVFSIESLDDEYKTVIFRSRIETKG
ncbi:MAG: hypothetical protein II591_00605, partial [Schwartzia sp.]|nr:hypothetical protein [Schwartzia sp. (in: firmicutes)]